MMFLHLSFFVCVCLCVFKCASVPWRGGEGLHVFACVFFFVCLSVCVSRCVSVQWRGMRGVTCVCICVSLCVFECVFVCVYLSVSAFMEREKMGYMCAPMCLHVCLCFCNPASSSHGDFGCLCACPFLHDVCVFVVYLHLFVCVCVSLPVSTI